MTDSQTKNIITLLRVYSDGGARGNPGPAAIGFVVKDAQGRKIYQEAQTIGEATNNMAEYQAVIAALNWLIKQTQTSNVPKSVHFFLDSRLVTNQLNGVFKVKDQKLRNLVIKVRELEKKAGLSGARQITLFEKEKSKISYQEIPREMNSEADSLVNAALDKLPIPP